MKGSRRSLHSGSMFSRSRLGWPMRLSASWRLVSEAVPSAIVVSRLAAQQRLCLRRRSTGVAAQDRRLAPVGRTGTGTLAIASVAHGRSEEHKSELQSLMRRSYAVFFLHKNKPSQEIPY